MGPEALAQVLRPLTKHTHPDLIVGLQTSDDAAVFRLADDLAVIQTIDFFPPVVDDAYTYGAISAANSMSDVFAMGGEVLFALNVAAFPANLPLELLSAIFEGGSAKVIEAGGVIAGGHTVTDDEPKYGLSVTGRLHPDRILTKAGARPGDYVYVTKPIGTGVVTTALKNASVDAADLASAVASMLTLNLQSSRLVRDSAASACTDVTGFGLLGHASEMAEKSGVRLRLIASAVPLLPGAERYAADGHQPGGLRRNRDYYGGGSSPAVTLDAAIAPDLAALLFGPETSGGLLVTVPPSDAVSFERSFAANQIPIWRIGDVVEGRGIEVNS
jgi:selenide,water dikinase